MNEFAYLSYPKLVLPSRDPTLKGFLVRRERHGLGHDNVVVKHLSCFFIALHDESASLFVGCLLYTSPSPRDATLSRMPSSA